MQISIRYITQIFKANPTKIVNKIYESAATLVRYPRCTVEIKFSRISISKQEIEKLLNLLAPEFIYTIETRQSSLVINLCANRGFNRRDLARKLSPVHNPRSAMEYNSNSNGSIITYPSYHAPPRYTPRYIQ